MVLAQQLPIPVQHPVVPVRAARQERVHRSAVVRVRRAERGAQPHFLALHPVGHVEVVHDHVRQNDPPVAEEHQGPQEDEETAQVHGIANDGIGAVAGEVHVLVERGETPELNEFPGHGYEKPGQQPAWIRQPQERDHERKRHRHTGSRPHGAQAGVVEERVQSVEDHRGPGSDVRFFGAGRTPR